MNNNNTVMDNVNKCSEHTIAEYFSAAIEQIGKRVNRIRKCSVCGIEFTTIEMDQRIVSGALENHESLILELREKMTDHQNNEMALVVETYTLKKQIAALNTRISRGAK